MKKDNVITTGIYTVKEMDHGLWVNDKFVSNEQVEEILLLQSKGLTLREISKQVGVSLQRVTKVWEYKK
jgi:hypothetical protein